jgi:molybdopterin-guanine dinucleotide biosynthesis protein A
MGQDKALLRVDGEPMALRVANALRAAGADSVVCVGGDEPSLRALGLDVIADDQPGEGPLVGFLGALRWSATAITVVSPCDLISPRASSFRTLVEALSGDASALAAVPIVDGRWRALPIALRSSAAPMLTESFTAGERAVHRALERVPFVEVDAGPLADADEPEDLDGRR